MIASIRPAARIRGVNAVPDIPAHAVDRPELRRRLDEGVERPLTLVIAPAGSGKSVLLSQWSASRPDLRIAWLDVDASDDDPVHFLRHLLAALDVPPEVAVALGGLLPLNGGTSLGEEVRDELVALLAAASPLVAVFDDVHRLTARGLLADLEWMIDHAPDGVRFVLSSRADLRRAPRRRLHDPFVELRGAELALDASTADSLIRQVSGARLSDASMDAILARTEGWAAGVQLSAIALRHHDDAEAFATGFAGTDRLVADYLSEEVLASLPEDRRELLLRASALERMSADLVDAVLDGEDGRTFLRELERESMFLVPLDDRGEWFRFHHLFRQLLRYRLDARHPGAAHDIAIAAARWYSERNEPDMAIRSLLDAEAWGAVMDLILTRGRDVYERGEANTVSQWLSTIPEHVRRTRPDAEALHGILLGMIGRAAEGEDVLAGIDRLPAATIGHRLIAQSYRASRVQFRADAVISRQIAEQALSLLASNEGAQAPDLLGLTRVPFLEVQASGGLGRARFFLGDLDGARATLRQTLHLPGATYTPFRIHLLGSLALTEAWAGRLRVADDLAREALYLAEQTDLLLHAAPADAHLARAIVRIEEGDAAGALQSIEAGMLRARANNRTQLSWIGVLALSAATDDLDLSDAPAAPPPPIVADRLRAAAERQRRLGSPTILSTPHAGTAVEGWSRARAEHVARLLTAHDSAAARDVLRAIRPPSPIEEPGARVEFLLLHAWLASSEARRSQSVAHVAAAMTLAERHGLVEVFSRVCPPATVLRDAVDATTPFGAAVLRAAQQSSAPAPTAGAAGPLTERESDLLPFLPTRLSNVEIAAKLNVSVNTVKSHMTHIYRKFGVTTRDDAIAKARELSLL
jgi:ATP/maltotriose-dependent transcriptional regulator MalT